MSRGLLAAVFLLPLSGPSAAEPAASREQFLGRFVFRTHAEEQGLTDVSVECVIQDRIGFLWAGTDDGLFRFDGRRFVKYSREQGLPRTRIYQLHETADGRLYVATAAGLARQHGDRFEVIGEKAGLGTVAIGHQGVASDAAGTLYVGTDRGLYVGRDDVFTLDEEANAVEQGPVGAVHADSSGAVYFARGGRLYRREAGRVAEFGGPRGLPTEETIDEVLSDRSGRLWVRTVKRLFVLPRGADRFAQDDQGLPESSEYGRLAFDERGELLVPTVQGLAFRDAGGWRMIGRREGLPSDTALSAIVDREGSLWIGTLGGGLAQRLGHGEFTNWSTSDGLSHEVVWAIARQRTPSGPGALWVGTEQGLNRIDPQTGAVRVFFESDGLAGNTVNAVAAGQDGSIWAGSWPEESRGFFRTAGRFDTAPRTRLPISFASPPSACGRMGRSGSARSTVSTAWPPGRRTTSSSGFRSGREKPDGVRGFAEDPSGVLYAASKQGILRLTGPAPRKFTRTDGLREDFVSSIAFASDGSLVVAYRESIGAAKVILQGDRLTVRPIDTSTGLISNKVVLVGRDASGSVWIGTGSGADVFGPDWALAARYGKADGMISADLDQNAFLAEPDGTVWLGSSRGVIRVQAGVPPAPKPAPTVVIIDARAGDRPLAPGLPAVLGSGERNFSVAWSGLTFIEPSHISN